MLTNFIFYKTFNKKLTKTTKNKLILQKGTNTPLNYHLIKINIKQIFKTHKPFLKFHSFENFIKNQNSIINKKLNFFLNLFMVKNSKFSNINKYYVKYKTHLNLILNILSILIIYINLPNLINSNSFFINFRKFNYFNCKSDYNLFFKKLNLVFSKKSLHENKVFYSFFLNSCFEFLFKGRFFIKIDNNSNLKNSKLFKKYNFLKNFEKSNNYFCKNFKNTNFKVFIKILINFLIKKDATIILNWLLRNMEKMPLKSHKKFLTFFKNLILDNSDKIINYFEIKGIFFDIRGKVGVAGNSKKRHFFFHIGNLKYSSKNSKMDFQQGVIKTYTGCLGLTFILAY